MVVPLSATLSSLDDHSRDSRTRAHWLTATRDEMRMVDFMVDEDEFVFLCGRRVESEGKDGERVCWNKGIEEVKLTLEFQDESGHDQGLPTIGPTSLDHQSLEPQLPQQSELAENAAVRPGTPSTAEDEDQSIDKLIRKYLMLEEDENQYMLRNMED